MSVVQWISRGKLSHDSHLSLLLLLCLHTMPPPFAFELVHPFSFTRFTLLLLFAVILLSSHLSL